jgi:hypothetical protein
MSATNVLFRGGGEGEGSARQAQQSSQGILRFYTDEAPGFQMYVFLACDVCLANAKFTIRLFTCAVAPRRCLLAV